MSEEKPGLEEAPGATDPGLRFAAVVLALSVVPFLLTLVGVDFGTAEPAAGSGSTEEAYRELAGPFLHTLFEWGALCVALFTALLGLLHFRMTRDLVTPVIGLALLAAGLMDGFHILAADRLVPAADAEDFIPFTWAIGRLFCALILIVGAGLVTREASSARGSRAVWVAAAVFGGLAAAVMVVSAISPDLPRTTFSGRLYTRPWDVAPLVIFFFGAVWAFPRVHRQRGSTFSLALWISVIPHIATQLHVAFGSAALYDSHFFVAHYLKVLAYGVPLAGLMVDYVRLHRDLRDREVELAAQAEQLRRTNAQLEEFASVAAQDLQEPLREVAGYVDLIERHFKGKLGDIGDEYVQRATGASFRMQAMLNDLLLYTQVRGSGKPLQPTPLEEVVKRVQTTLRRKLEREEATLEVGELPVISGDRGQLVRAFTCLVDNALKFRSEATPEIRIEATDVGEDWLIQVRDNGVGMDPARSHQVFKLFKRLGDDKPGTGVGLALCSFVVERHGGAISFDSAPGEGTTFLLTFPKPI